VKWSGVELAVFTPAAMYVSGLSCICADPPGDGRYTEIDVEGGNIQWMWKWKWKWELLGELGEGQEQIVAAFGLSGFLCEVKDKRKPRRTLKPM